MVSLPAVAAILPVQRNATVRQRILYLTLYEGLLFDSLGAADVAT